MQYIGAAHENLDRASFVFSFRFSTIPERRAAGDLGWQPQKTWVFVVGVLSWKHSETYGSFPVKNRRDNTLVDLFKEKGVPESQIVYLQDKQATQQRIDKAFTEQLKKLAADDLLIVYYAGHGSKSEDGNDVYLASYDAGDNGVDGWSVNSIPAKINGSKCSRVLWLIDCCYSGQAGLAITKQTERSRLCRRDVIGRERIVDRTLDLHRSAARRAARRFLR